MRNGFKPLRGLSGGTAGLFDWYRDYRAGMEGGGAFAGPAPPVYDASDLCLPSATPEQQARCAKTAAASHERYAEWRQRNWWDPTFSGDNPNKRGLPVFVKAIGALAALFLGWLLVLWASAPRASFA